MMQDRSLVEVRKKRYLGIKPEGPFIECWQLPNQNMYFDQLFEPSDANPELGIIRRTDLQLTLVF